MPFYYVQTYKLHSSTNCYKLNSKRLTHIYDSCNCYRIHDFLSHTERNRFEVSYVLLISFNFKSDIIRKYSGGKLHVTFYSYSRHKLQS